MTGTCKATWEATRDYPAGKCDRVVVSRGVCGTHYAQSRKCVGFTPIAYRYVNRNSDPTGYRTCSLCREVLPEQAFGRRSDNGELTARCRDCQQACRFKRNGKWIREQCQQGCALCGFDFTPVRANKRVMRDAHIDHNHACCDSTHGSCGGCVRGVLHVICNAQAVSWYESVRGTIEPIEFFERYLQKYETPEQTLAAGVDRLPETEKDAA